MTITYAISVHNEHVELTRLLNFLLDEIRLEDSIVVQGDAGKVTKEVISSLRPFLFHKNFTYIEHPLKKDFATFKNSLKHNCTGDWIFNIDADEIPHPNLVKSLPELLQEYSDVDIFYVPRINTVEGITDEYIKEQRWVQNANGWINYPDYQTRIFKNDPNLKWEGKVHERLIGGNVIVQLPSEEEWSLYHPKTFERQVKQNNFYSTINA